MNTKSLYRSLLTLGLSLLVTAHVFAQDHLDIQISGVGASQIPVTIAGFANEAAVPRKVTEMESERGRCTGRRFGRKDRGWESRCALPSFRSRQGVAIVRPVHGGTGPDDPCDGSQDSR